VPRGTEGLADAVSDGLELPDSARAVLEQALPAQPETRGAFGIVGLLIVVISGTSYSRALARMYGKVWDVRPPGWAVGWRWVATLFGVLLLALALRALHGAAGGTVYATAGELAATLVLNGLLWTWVPWLLLTGQVSWRRLLPGGVLMGICTVVTSVVSGVYLPRALLTAARQFGALGVAFTYIGWLFVVSFALICSTVVGAVLARDESRLTRLITGDPGARDPGGRAAR